MPKQVERYLSNWNDEVNSAILYQSLAETEKDPKIADVYRRLAATEQKHADAWADKVRAAGGAVPIFRVSWRTRMLTFLARRLGAQAVLPTIVSAEQRNSNDYAAQSEASDMVAAEQSHARLLQHISRSTNGGMEGGALAQLEGRHRTPGGNALRAAVLGASDGLLSNLSLVMGVVGANLSPQSTLVAGIAGLLAGASSMALGEWLSVQSSRELFEKQIATEREEIESAPEEEAEELALIYQSRGLKKAQARQLATQIISNQASALETLAREELGVDPQELGGSAWEAAITSFLLFAIGAVIPVVAFVLLGGMTAVIVSLSLSTIGLFVIGAFITLFTGRSVLYSGMRQVIFGLLAAAVTFGIGRLVGVNLGG